MTASPEAVAVTDNAAYCDDLLKEADPHRWLALRFAPAPRRRALRALYAVHAEIARAPHAVSEAPLGEIRLQWWREAIAEILGEGAPRRHPVVQEGAATHAIPPAARDLVDGAIDARARFLYAEPFVDLEDAIAWACAAEGYLATVRTPHADDALVRAEAVFALAGYDDEDAAKRGLDRPALAQAAEPIMRDAAQALAGLAPEEAGLHAHLALVGRRLRARPGPFADVADRWRLFTATLTGRF
ncbi:MAG: squalene/phytoene synthase family protein [Pseudomonadota bacterium]